MRNTIKICRAALDEVDGNIVLRGVIANDSLDKLGIDDYQREMRPLSSLQELIEAYKKRSRVPDVELGMRGQAFMEKDGSFYLKDGVFIIDGLQRISAGIRGIATGEITEPHIGCIVHFDTTKEWERDRFRILNTKRSKVSPNILIRNMKDTSPAIKMLHNLSTNDKSFALKGRVCWNQAMKREDVITARTFLGTISRLHSHLGPGRSTAIEKMVKGIDTTMETVGKQIMRDNTKRFFDFVDAAWGLRNIAYSGSVTHTKQVFLHVLALLISDHTNFWPDADEKRLVIKRADGQKLSKFPVSDPTVQQLASGASSSGDMLYMLIQKHFDSGKRTGHLKPRVARIHAEYDDEVGDSLESQSA